MYHLTAFDVALLATWGVDLLLQFETRQVLQRMNGLNVQYCKEAYQWGSFSGRLNTALGGFT